MKQIVTVAIVLVALVIGVAVIMRPPVMLDASGFPADRWVWSLVYDMGGSSGSSGFYTSDECKKARDYIRPKWDAECVPLPWHDPRQEQKH